MDNLALLLLFVCCYIVVMFIGYCLDKMLRKIFGKGIFPAEYFKL